MPQRRASGPPQKLDPIQLQALQQYADAAGNDRTTFWGRCQWYVDNYGGLTPAQLSVLVEQMAEDAQEQQATTGGDDQTSSLDTTTPTTPSNRRNPYDY